MACPASGPCLRWGPAPGSIPGMGSPLPQYVMVSTDQGKTWLPNGPSVELRETGPHELVIFNDQVAAVLSGSGEFPARETQDSGKTWHTVALPPAPGVDPNGPLFPGLQMLPNGSLFVKESEGAVWALLAPGASAWCTVTADGLPTTPVLLQAAGDTLWWQDPTTLQVQGFPLSQVQCGG